MSDSNQNKRSEVEAEFRDGNRDPESTRILSPSGRFELVIQDHTTAGWNYSRGTVRRVVDGEEICDIKRNINFHYSFITKGDREYLVTGRSYMSQTIVDLTRGIEYEPEGDHYDSVAFCWTGCTLSPDGNTLAVDGCIWACPYELRFYDFTDPARGWPELEVAGDGIVDPSDKRPSQWIDRDTIECFHSDDETGPQERTRLQRRGNEMVVIEHWVSDAEQDRRAERVSAEAAQELWWKEFSTTNPVYARFVELVRARGLPSDTLGGRPGGHCVVKYFRRADPHASADLRWHIDDATLKVQLYTAAGLRDQELSFPGTVEGIEAAVDRIARLFGS